MKVLVLALVLANALFFMWSTWVAEPPVELTPRQVGGDQELTLLAELDNAPELDTDAEGDSVAAQADVAADVPADELAPESTTLDAAGRAANDAERGAVLEPMLDAIADAGSEQTSADDVAQPEVPEAAVDEAVADVVGDAEPEPDSPAPPETVAAAEPDSAVIEPEAGPADISPAPVEPAEGIQVALADVPDRCASLGPFPDLREASAAASRLRANGYDPGQRLAEENVWVGHWVYLPSFPSRSEAVAAVERLRELGVKDIYIEPRGDRENAVSLGLFSDRENAELYAGQVRQHDVRPQITDRYRVGSAYWLDIELLAGQSPDPAAYQRDEARKLRLEPRDCDATRVAERDAGD